MNKVHIVVDSTANVPGQLLANHDNLHVVPIKVILGEHVMDEPELTADEIFEYVDAKGPDPTTSQPAPGEFSVVFDKIVNKGATAVVITVSVLEVLPNSIPKIGCWSLIHVRPESDC